MDMKPKQIAIITGICALSILLIFLGWYFYPRPLGYFNEEDVESLFTASKIENEDSNGDKKVNGINFFQYLKKFLESLEGKQHAINSACTEGKYDGTDNSGKGEFVKEVIVKAIKVSFWGGKSSIDEILKSNESDITKEVKDDREKGILAYGKLLIYNIFKKIHSYNSFDNYIKEWKDSHVEEHLAGLSGEEVSKLKIKVKDDPNSDTHFKVFDSIDLFLYTEIHILSTLIPADLAKKSSTSGDDEVKKLEKEKKDKLDALNTEEQKAIDKRKKQGAVGPQEIDKIKADFKTKRDQAIQDYDAKIAAAKKK